MSARKQRILLRVRVNVLAAPTSAGEVVLVRWRRFKRRRFASVSLGRSQHAGFAIVPPAGKCPE